ncbi:ubiquinol oxidase 2, mitochondrial [Trifolium repens]|nr:ubiquinol oxidase 2, mitochondrial [Trifolium repens]WGC84536.1 mitochondrial alternative oxidase 2a [Trifolium repens]
MNQIFILIGQFRALKLSSPHPIKTHSHRLTPSTRRDAFLGNSAKRDSKMHSALCYAIRRAMIGGRNCNRHGSAVMRPFMAEEMRRRNFGTDGGNGGFFHWKRMMSSKAASETEVKSTEKEKKEESSGKKNNVVVSSYWGISRPKITREDGTEWPWNCFMPWETYQSNLSIDLSKHHVPKNFLDKVAYKTVKLLRIPTDLFFKRQYGCRAMMLETVAAVPGMVGGMLLHLRSLRKFQQSGGWIKALLEEAENERMHLMTMVELVKPKWYERLLVLAVQGVFFNAFFVVYILSPKLAHRVVGYLEEEAVHSYTEYLKDIESGAVENVPAPAIAIDYWRLPKDAKLKDVITVIRADEAHHRDVNHFASDIHFQGKELRDAPAPLGYH